MKTLIAFSVMLICQFAFANPLPKKESDLVIRAIRESLAVSDLNCTSKADGKFKASGMNWAFIEKNGLVTINEGEQPVITLKAEDGRTEFLLDITTNEAITAVTKINGHAAQISKGVRNVGTITNPRFEDTIVRTNINPVSCE